MGSGIFGGGAVATDTGTKAFAVGMITGAAASSVARVALTGSSLPRLGVRIAPSTPRKAPITRSWVSRNWRMVSKYSAITEEADVRRSSIGWSFMRIVLLGA